MRDEWSPDRCGWARFSDCGSHRFWLSRQLTEHASSPWAKVTFIMLNPSTADAFKVDPTISRCIKFARQWGADRLDVVNLFSFRTPYPNELWRASDRGDGPDSDDAIIEACTDAQRVVAAWGAGGLRYGRAEIVRSRLAQRDIRLWHLGLTNEGQPLHPLARGKSFVPYARELTEWA